MSSTSPLGCQIAAPKTDWKETIRITYSKKGAASLQRLCIGSLPFSARRVFSVVLVVVIVAAVVVVEIMTSRERMPSRAWSPVKCADRWMQKARMMFVVVEPSWKRSQKTIFMVRRLPSFVVCPRKKKKKSWVREGAMQPPLSLCRPAVCVFP
jgi:hypothetical protein